MTAFTRGLTIVALAAACSMGVAAQDRVPAPAPPVPQPLPPASFDPPGGSPLEDKPVPASLRQQPEPIDEFVPVDELPPGDQLPAAPLLVSAYGFVLLALFGYLLSVARRLGVVQREVERLELDMKRSGRA
jgi:CcmD family protein